jgi:hypothetical protein
VKIPNPGFYARPRNRWKSLQLGSGFCGHRPTLRDVSIFDTRLKESDLHQMKASLRYLGSTIAAARIGRPRLPGRQTGMRRMIDAFAAEFCALTSLRELGQKRFNS